MTKRKEWGSQEDEDKEIFNWKTFLPTFYRGDTKPNGQGWLINFLLLLIGLAG